MTSDAVRSRREIYPAACHEKQVSLFTFPHLDGIHSGPHASLKQGLISGVGLGALQLLQSSFLYPPGFLYFFLQDRLRFATPCPQVLEQELHPVTSHLFKLVDEIGF